MTTKSNETGYLVGVYMRGAETAWSVQCLGRGLDCRRVVRLPAVARYIYLCKVS